MASLNKVQIIGNAGRDAEVRHSASGMAVANVTIATTSRRKDKQSGETIEDTQWHRVTFYDRLAEIAGQYVKKGKPVYVEGRLKYGTYTDKTTGVEKPTCDIIASEMQLLGGREDSPGRTVDRSSAQAPRQAQTNPAQRTGSGFDDMDDDIPF